MGFGEAVRTCLTKYVTFDGRARRSEFWYFVLFQILVSIAAAIIDSIVFPRWELGGDQGPVQWLTNVVLLLPSIAVTCRRLHDIDKSGWWQLLNFIPIIGWIIMLIWTIRDGQRHQNRFGYDPKGQLSGPPGGPQDYVPPRPY
ncbi:uncharacterized membrane protein YhaH (DUF805 family) [Kineosphaera limosa]|uniref:DUF805 domain-containing protein n=1 Tax=Kineosphaera limosa NBRC 100340 TaxID=1184609 RepID=K6WMX6_9MICO|nr:DUF805 domain-containing protein [Kineosphaera limosa]NYE01420.1 uncharacterized membrane protein YhaH (DUF805 family) [Kineosphaera limosa]GAB95166.1 hypothetical protein KILIM_017_00110 [Kineosphaera limosa NBRC 100340]